MIQIIPAIIPDTLETVREKFGQVLGLVSKVQVDFIDGRYSPVQSWPFNGGDWNEEFPFIKDFIIEADLLVFNPIFILDKLIKKGFESFVLHLDSADDLNPSIALVKTSGCEMGLGIKPSGDIKLLEKYLPEADFVQFMGNDKVGYNGVELDEKVLDKIQNFHAAHPHMPLQVDIGVNFETAPKLIEAGISRLISGSAIFESELGVAEAIKKLLTCALRL